MGPIAAIEWPNPDALMSKAHATCRGWDRKLVTGVTGHHGRLKSDPRDQQR